MEVGADYRSVMMTGQFKPMIQVEVDGDVDSMLGRKAGLEDDLSYAMRGVLDAVRQAALQITLTMQSLNDRFKDVSMLEFEGYETLQSDFDAAWKALEAAVAALQHLVAFQPPKEVRIATVIEQLLRKQGESDEAKS